MINGSCQLKDKCHHCVDSNIIHQNHATWRRDKCTKCHCKGNEKMENALRLDETQIWYFSRQPNFL